MIRIIHLILFLLGGGYMMYRAHTWMGLAWFDVIFAAIIALSMVFPWFVGAFFGGRNGF